MKYVVLFLFFIFSVQNSLCSNIRSTEEFLRIKITIPSDLLDKKTELDTLKRYLKSISKKATTYRKNEDFKNAFLALAKLRKESKKYKDTNYIALSYKKEALYKSEQGFMVKSLECYVESLKLYKKIESNNKVIKVLRSIANIQNDFGLYSQAESSSIDGLKYIDSFQIKDNTTEAWLYNSLARSYKERSIYKKSIDKFKQALNVAEGKKEKRSIIQNIALLYYEAGNYDRSIQILDSLKRKINLDSDSLFYARVISNLSKIKYLAGNKDSSTEIGFLEALEIRKLKNDLRGLFSSYIHLAQFYSLDNKLKSFYYAKEAYKTANRLNSYSAKIESLEYLIKLSPNYLIRGYSLQHIDFNSKLAKERDKASEMYASYRYDFQEEEKKKIEALQLKAESDLKVSKSEKQNLLLLFGIIFLFLLSVITYYIQRQRAKQKVKLSQLQERYQTETRLSKKIHDEVGNDIFYLMTQVEKDPSLLQEKGLKLLDGLQTIYSKARDISREYTDIDTGEAFPDELLSLLNSFGNQEVRIITRQLAPDFWDAIEGNAKAEVFRIVQELLTNMKKHSQASRVAVTFKKDTQNLTIQYADNGVGIEETKPTLRSVENRIDVLKGVLTFDSQSDEGLNVSIILPI